MTGTPQGICGWSGAAVGRRLAGGTLLAECGHDFGGEPAHELVIERRP